MCRVTKAPANSKTQLGNMMEVERVLVIAPTAIPDLVASARARMKIVDIELGDQCHDENGP